jgi:hypothetical protein
MKLVGVDIGRTFTDLILADLERDRTWIHKVPTPYRSRAVSRLKYSSRTSSRTACGSGSSGSPYPPPQGLIVQATMTLDVTGTAELRAKMRKTPKS